MQIFIPMGVDTTGIPVPAEVANINDISDPEYIRRELGAMKLAQALFPCVDSRTTHWKYYLFTAPGRNLITGKRLLKVLEKTKDQGIRGGIGRVAYNKRGNRKASQNFESKLLNSFNRTYRRTTEKFWRPESQEPAESFVRASREYVKNESFEDFFNNTPLPGIKSKFFTHLKAFRPNIAKIAEKKMDLHSVVVASKSWNLDDDEKKIIFIWTALRALFQIQDGCFDQSKGKEDDSDSNDDSDDDDVSDDEEYAYAKSQELFDYASVAIKLSKDIFFGEKQFVVEQIVERLAQAVKMAGSTKSQYTPPFNLAARKSNGKKRRIFSSLRLGNYIRLLNATRGK